MASPIRPEGSMERFFNYALLASLLLHCSIWLLLMTVEPPPPPTREEYATWVQKVTPPKVIEEAPPPKAPEIAKKPVIEEEIDEGEPAPKGAVPPSSGVARGRGKPGAGPSGGRLGGPPGKPGLRQQLSGAGLLATIGVASEEGGLANVFESGSAVVGKDLGQALSERGAVRVTGGTRIGRKGALGAGTGADFGEVDAGGGGGGPGAVVGNMGGREGVAPQAFVKSSEAVLKKGGIDEKGVRMALKRRERGIQQCYERELKSNSKLKGKLMLEWNIDESGRVVNVSVLQNTLGDQRVADCVSDIISRIRFPGAEKGLVPVRKTFVFESGA